MKDRLQWLDAMRGLTMTLVVSYHVAVQGFGETEKLSAALPLLVLLRMPAFFFVSGFLAYKANFQWTLPNALRLAWKKVRIQVLPALVFMAVFVVLRRSGDFATAFERALRSPTKAGYWFTWSLLHIFLIYYAVCLASRRRTWPLWIMWVVALGLYAMQYMPQWFSWHKTDFMRFTSLVMSFRFLHFFLFGNLVRRHWQGAQRLFDSKWLFPVLTIVATVCCFDLFRWHTLRMAWTNLPRTMAMYSLLLMLVMFFRHYAAWFSRERLVGRVMQTIGTRTLDIYLLHFLLLPKLPDVGRWLNANQPNFLLDIVVSTAGGLVVIGACLLLSNVLSTSAILRKHLFGRNKPL